MSMLFRRKAIIPVWVVVFGLFALFAPPMTLAAGAFMLLGWGMALAIMLFLWKKPSPTVHQVLHHAKASRTE